MLSSFQAGGTKFERFLPKNQHNQRKLLNFEDWINGKVSKSDKIRLSKSIFYLKNHRNLSQFFSSLKNTNLGAHYLLLTFFDIIKYLITLAEILTALSLVLNSDSQGLPNVYSWELNISKFLVVEKVGGTNFHGFIFLWVREDEIFVNFKLGNHKDDRMQEFKQT